MKTSVYRLVNGFNLPGCLLFCCLPFACLLFGCEDLGVIPPVLPSVVSFTAGPNSVLEGDTIVFRFRAASDKGLARGIIDYMDGTKRDSVALSGTRDSAHASHIYLQPGWYKPTLTLEDVAGERSGAIDTVYVRANLLPVITSIQLRGYEGAVSRTLTRDLATDPEGDSFTISVTPVSPGLVFQKNAKGDSVIFYLTDPNDNGTKQGKITVVDQKNRTEEKVITILFAPLDDISGRVHDRFEGTYLASYNPAAVMQGPLTGWVAAITGSDTVRVPVDAGGRYILPKLPFAPHILRAFITNGTDSSFIATNQISSGDRIFDIAVETNAGTGMPLGRLLTMYQIVNFQSQEGNAIYSCLAGIDLKNNAGQYVYYLFGRDTTLDWFNAKHFTAEQQDWVENEILTRCFAHILPSHRPRIVKGTSTDPVPVSNGNTRDMNPPYYPAPGYIVVYANLIPLVTPGQISLWDRSYDGIYDCGRIALNGGDSAAPTYGFSIIALVKGVESSISGAGVLHDPYYNSKSTRAENSTLDSPSTADMKLDWQVVLELPGEHPNSYVVERFFELP